MHAPPVSDSAAAAGASSVEAPRKVYTNRHYEGKHNSSDVVGKGSVAQQVVADGK